MFNSDFDFDNGNFVHFPKITGSCSKLNEFFKKELKKDFRYVWRDICGYKSGTSVCNFLHLDMKNKKVFCITKLLWNTSGGALTDGVHGKAFLMEDTAKKICDYIDFKDYHGIVVLDDRTINEKDTTFKRQFSIVEHFCKKVSFLRYSEYGKYVSEGFMPTWKKELEKEEKTISKGNEKIKNILNELHTIYEEEKVFYNCLSPMTGAPLKFDFYLPTLNICIEYDGEQHYKSVEYFGGEKKYIEQKERDLAKDKYCFENNIKLIRIPFTDFKKITPCYLSSLIAA